MSTPSTPETLLQAKNASTPDLTPAPLTPNNSRVSFLFQDVPPPSILYVDVDDRLVLQAATSTNNEVVTVNVRLLLPDGRLEDMQFQVRPLNTRAVLAQNFSLAQGYILSVSAVAAQAITRGQTFLRISTQRGASGPGNPAQMLFADYVTTQATSAYPNGRVLSPVEGPGFVYFFAESNPAAGADWGVVLPANTRWRVRGMTGVLTTSAAVANRQPSIAVLGSTGQGFQGFPTVNAVASGTYHITAGGIAPYTAINPLDIPLPLPPDLVLASTSGVASAIQGSTVGLQAGDQWSAVALLIEEWLDNV
jgi:hypothetical protein